MEAVTRAEVVACLRSANPRATDQEIELYASHFLDYQEAEQNIRKHGTIVLHPRTGAPIDNPYSRIKGTSSKQLRGFRLQTNELWRLVALERES